MYFHLSVDRKRLYHYTGAHSILLAFWGIQWEEKPYNVFLRELRSRLRRYTGRSVISFYSEEQLADLLVELGEVQFRAQEEQQ